MAFKFVLLAAWVAVARAGNLGLGLAAAPLASLPIANPVIAKTVVAEEYDPNPQYSYGYQVEDGLTGDSKNHVESRSGDVVQGSYSLSDPDGTRRTVEYSADPINGFNAVVHKEPLAKAVIATPAITKTVVAAPAIPAPIARTIISAPTAITSQQVIAAPAISRTIVSAPTIAAPAITSRLINTPALAPAPLPIASSTYYGNSLVRTAPVAPLAAAPLPSAPLAATSTFYGTPYLRANVW